MDGIELKGATRNTFTAVLEMALNLLCADISEQREEKEKSKCMKSAIIYHQQENRKTGAKKG